MRWTDGTRSSIRNYAKNSRTGKTIRGICRNLVPHSNGTISLHLSDEKTSGWLFH